MIDWVSFRDLRLVHVRRRPTRGQLFIQEMNGACGDHLGRITEVATLGFELPLTPEMQAVDWFLAVLAAALDLIKGEATDP